MSTARRLLFVLAFTVAGCGVDPTGNEPESASDPRGKSDGDSDLDSIRVLTWNIGRVYLGASIESRAAEEDLEHVASVIKEQGAQLVALQEIAHWKQVDQLLLLLGPEWSGRASDDNYDRHAAVLTRLAASFMPLETQDGRTAQGAKLTIRGQRLVFASVHLDAFDAEKRLAQAQDMLVAIGAQDPGAMVMAGDFNSDAEFFTADSQDQALYKLLTQEHVLVDAGVDQGPTALLGRRLDSVFYRGALFDWSDAEVIKGERRNRMDHDPLLVQFALAR
jgi:endonuclease/exonuclease/phosphatase family metal-dependent hydrolase